MDLTKYISKRVEPFLSWVSNDGEEIEVELRLGDNWLYDYQYKSNYDQLFQRSYQGSFIYKLDLLKNSQNRDIFNNTDQLITKYPF